MGRGGKEENNSGVSVSFCQASAGDAGFEKESLCGIGIYLQEPGLESLAGELLGEWGNRALLWLMLRAPAGRGSAPKVVHGQGRMSGLGWI